MISVVYLDHMGSDISVIRAARQSFDGDAVSIGTKEISLLNYLARGFTQSEWHELLKVVTYGLKGTQSMFEHLSAQEILWLIKNQATHFAPFTHPKISVRCHAPLSIARQIWKSQIGVVGADSDVAWSEMSMRYVDRAPKFHDVQMHKRAENIKQGSTDDIIDYATFLGIEHSTHCAELYNDMLKHGIAPEDARNVLPVNTMTSWTWTGSLYFFAKLYLLRSNLAHVQKDTVEFTKCIEAIVSPLFPHSWVALTTGDLF